MRFTKLVALLFSSFVLFVGCGEEDPKIVKDFTFDVSVPNVIEFEVEFNSDLTLNTELLVPVMHYGFVRLMPNMNTTGVKLATGLNIAAFEDPRIINLSRTRRLPNQQAMSPYVERDVGRLWIKANDQVATSVYFGFDTEKFYLGTAIELSFIDSDFPTGLVITQRLRDLKNRPLGVVSLYGPKVDGGKVTAPGGFFVMTNVSDLIRYAEADRQRLGEAFEGNTSLRSSGLQPSKITEINQDEYKRREKLYELFMLYRQKAAEAGM